MLELGCGKCRVDAINGKRRIAEPLEEGMNVPGLCGEESVTAPEDGASS